MKKQEVVLVPRGGGKGKLVFLALAVLVLVLVVQYPAEAGQVAQQLARALGAAAAALLEFLQRLA